jgi:predicted ATP-grasp superfamily ATP-dependent carboligase
MRDGGTEISMANAQSKVLIVDKVAVLGLEICRAVAAQGCRVDVFAGKSSPIFRSRFCNRRIVSPPFEDAARFCDALERTVSSESYDAIHICHEEILARVHPVLEQSHWKGLLTPPPEKLKIALSKNAALALAARIGVATPRTRIPESAEQAAVMAREFDLPIVLKGDTGESGENVRIVWQREQAADKYREVVAGETRSGSCPALQEFVRGPAYSIGGLFFKGEPLRVVVHRKLIRYPYPFGGLTVKGVTEREPDLLRDAFKIFAELEYSGLGHVEFIRDGRDGRFKFLEINPRPWGSIGLARMAGMDLFTPYRQLVAGIPPARDLRYREGILFHWIPREIQLMRQRPGRLLDFLKDSFDPRIQSDFRWTDPGPHLPSLSRLRKLARGTQHRVPSASAANKGNNAVNPVADRVANGPG